MKSSRMKLTKKLKSMKASEYLNQDRILQVLSAADGISDYLPKISNPISQITVGSMWKSPQKIDDHLEREEVSPSLGGDEENIRPPVNNIPRVPCDRKLEAYYGSDDKGIGRKSFGSGFRRPELNSRTLFDPKLLEAFELAVVCFRKINGFSREVFRVDDHEEKIFFPDEEQEDRRKDENALQLVNEITSEAGIEENSIGEDNNTLPLVTGMVNEQEEGRRKDDIALQLVNEITSEAGIEDKPIGEDNNTLPLVTGIVDEQEEDKRKDEITLQLVNEITSEVRIEEYDNSLPDSLLKCREKDENTLTDDVHQNDEGLRKDDNTLQIVNTTVEEVRFESGKDGNTLVDPLLEFEERCPPRGEESVVFYTTSLRGIRKTFDDCNMIRFLLDSFKVKYYERDVSMHRVYRDELRRVSAKEVTEVLPPVLFVKGRCIGGAQRVLSLHEQGKFKVLFDGVPLAGDKCCLRCDGFRFLMCDGCRGSRRVMSVDGTRIQCLLCNENGLIVCVDCS